MGTVPNSTPNYQQKETDQGQLYTFGSNQFLVETKVFREQITLGTVLENLMKSELDESLAVHSCSTE